MLNGTSGFGRRGPGLAGSSVDLSDAARQFVAQERGLAARQAEDAPRESDIDFTIGGSDIQYVEIELDPGEAVIAENGAMIWKDSDIELSMRYGDGSNDDAGMLAKVGSAARNVASGESVYLTQFTHTGSGRKARLALGGRSIGHIVPIKLDTIGGSLVARRGGMLAMAKGVRIDAQWQKRLSIGVIGGEGLIMQGLTGSGWVFLHVGGALIERDLAPGETISVDSGCVAAHQASVDLGVGFVGGLEASVMGNEGILLTTMRGPGKVWIQSMPERLGRSLDSVATARAGALAGATAGLAEGLAHGVAREGFGIVRDLW